MYSASIGIRIAPSGFPIPKKSNCIPREDLLTITLVRSAVLKARENVSELRFPVVRIQKQLNAAPKQDRHDDDIANDGDRREHRAQPQYNSATEPKPNVVLH